MFPAVLPFDRILRLLLLAAAALPALAGGAGVAPYQWRDEQGRMVFSDLPPAASIPAKQIIRSPPPAAFGSGRASDAAKAPTPDAATAVADLELAYRKREVERVEREKKESEESIRKLESANACSDAQGAIRALLSGQMISRIDASGERTYLSDEERAKQLKAARKSVGERC